MTNAKKSTVKKTQKKKQVKRPTTLTTKNRSIVPVGLGFPKKMLATIKYSEIIINTSTAGALAKWSFSTNGCTDPNVTGTGHQPYYFDQYMALYNHYKVIGSKCTFKVTPYLSNNTSTVVGAFINDDSTVTPTSLTDLMENSLAKHKMIATGQIIPVTWTLNWSAKKTFGQDVMAKDSLEGSNSSNPAE